MISLFDFLTENEEMFDFFSADMDPSNTDYSNAAVSDDDSEDKLIKKNFATGKWEGSRKNNNWYDPIINYISPAASGDLYQKRDNPNEQYVKFNDGTSFRYDLYDKNNPDTAKLISKMYHRDNTTPRVDPVDVGIGLGSDAIFAKPIQSIGSNVLKRPMNYVERSVAGSAGLAPVGPSTKSIQ